MIPNNSVLSYVTFPKDFDSKVVGLRLTQVLHCWTRYNSGDKPFKHNKLLMGQHICNVSA